MIEARVVTYGEVRLSQEALDHMGLQNGDILSVEKLPGGRLLLANSRENPSHQAVAAPVESDAEVLPHGLGQDHSFRSPPLKWYFCYNQESTGWFSSMIKVAVVSAKKNTNLIANCIYDGEQTPLVSWLQAQGVIIHRSRVPFYDRLFAPETLQRNQNSWYKAESAKGYYLPLQIAQIEREEEHVLFTDCDVMFTQEVDFRLFKPSGLAAAPEVADLSSPSPDRVQKYFNSGVMLINVQELRERMPVIGRILEDRGYFSFPEIGATYDQGLLNAAFESKWDALPPELNWRVFYGINPEASIIHWHGPKPPHVSDMLLFLAGKREKRRLSGPIMDMLLDNNIDSYRYYFKLYCQFLDIVSAYDNRDGLEI